MLSGYLRRYIRFREEKISCHFARIQPHFLGLSAHNLPEENLKENKILITDKKEHKH